MLAVLPSDRRAINIVVWVIFMLLVSTAGLYAGDSKKAAPMIAACSCAFVLFLTYCVSTVLMFLALRGDLAAGAAPKFAMAGPQTGAPAVGIAEDAALPEGWTEEADENGNVFYWNAGTEESSWTHPVTGLSK